MNRARARFARNISSRFPDSIRSLIRLVSRLLAAGQSSGGMISMKSVHLAIPQVEEASYLNLLLSRA
jgi:hypothetical protein